MLTPSTVPYDLAPAWERAERSAARDELRLIRRAFTFALRAASERRDVKPAVLLLARWP